MSRDKHPVSRTNRRRGTKTESRINAQRHTRHAARKAAKTVGFR